MGGRGWAGWSGVKGQKWDNCNSIINKYIKNIFPYLSTKPRSLAGQRSWGWQPVFLVCLEGARGSKMDLVLKKPVVAHFDLFGDSLRTVQRLTFVLSTLGWSDLPDGIR